MNREEASLKHARGVETLLMDVQREWLDRYEDCKAAIEKYQSKLEEVDRLLFSTSTNFTGIPAEDVKEMIAMEEETKTSIGNISTYVLKYLLEQNDMSHVIQKKESLDKKRRRQERYEKSHATKLSKVEENSLMKLHDLVDECDDSFFDTVEEENLVENNTMNWETFSAKYGVKPQSRIIQLITFDTDIDKDLHSLRNICKNLRPLLPQKCDNRTATSSMKVRGTLTCSDFVYICYLICRRRLDVNDLEDVVDTRQDRVVKNLVIILQIFINTNLKGMEQRRYNDISADMRIFMELIKKKSVDQCLMRVENTRISLKNTGQTNELSSSEDDIMFAEESISLPPDVSDYIENDIVARVEKVVAMTNFVMITTCIDSEVNFTKKHAGTFYEMLARSLGNISYGGVIPTPLTMESCLLKYHADHASEGENICGNNEEKFYMSSPPFGEQVSCQQVFHAAHMYFDINLLVLGEKTQYDFRRRGGSGCDEVIISLAMVKTDDGRVFVRLFPKSKQAVDLTEDFDNADDDANALIGYTTADFSPAILNDDAWNFLFEKKVALISKWSRYNKRSVSLEKFIESPPAIFEESMKALRNTFLRVSRSSNSAELMNIPLQSIDNESLTIGQFQSLVCSSGCEAWMSSFIMNYYSYHLHKTYSQPERTVTIFNTHFMNKLLEDRSSIYKNGENPNSVELDDRHYSHYNVFDWTRNRNIFDDVYIFCVVNVGNSHWTLLVADNSEDTLTYYDSMASSEIEVTNKWLNVFENYLIDEWKAQNGRHGMDVPTWRRHKHIPLKSAKQNDNHNCGVYVLAYMECILSNCCVDIITNRNVSKFRKLIALTILTGKLLY